jgi:6-phosphogluconolactonase (cycloisomerase 2 family)
MLKHLIAPMAALGLAVVVGAAGRPPVAAEVALPLLKSMEPEEICVMPPRAAAYQTSVASRATGDGAPPGWPGKQALGGNVPAARRVYDPHPTFNGMAVDPENDVVVMSDENRGSLLVYDRTAGGQAKEATEPRRHITGEKVDLGFIAGVTLDPGRREIYTVNNDGGGLVVHSYDGHGNVAPVRKLTVPHQTWGLSLDLKNDELAVTSQQYQGITIYRRSATRTDRPLRTIRGDKTHLADPHGIFLDPQDREVFTANHGNWTEMRTYSADGPPLLVGEYVPGRFEKPSIRVYDAAADGNVAPIRTVQGPKTALAWPMGMTVDATAREMAVANYGTNEILIFDKSANGDVAPIRVLGGDKTGIVGPIAVQIDRKNDEIWVANYGDHTAVVFDRTASGNVAPKRIVRNAPAGTPTTGFTNASAAAYDSKRDQLLVPN